MKLLRFNESSQDPMLDIIKEAFYVITDEYSLDISFNIESYRNKQSYDVTIRFEINNSFEDMNLALSQSKLLYDLIFKSNIAINHLKNDINFHRMDINSDNSDCINGIDILFTSLPEQKELFSFLPTLPGERLVGFSYNEILFKKWFLDFGVNVERISINKHKDIVIHLNPFINVDDLDSNKELMDAIYGIKYNNDYLIDKYSYNGEYVDGSLQEVKEIILKINKSVFYII